MQMLKVQDTVCRFFKNGVACSKSSIKRWIILLEHLEIFPSLHLTTLGSIKLCFEFKSHQFGELPLEAVTKISLV